MNTGPYKDGINTSEFYGSMTGGLSPVLAAGLIFFMTKFGVEPSEATQIVMYIGAFIVALPSIIYYIHKRILLKKDIIAKDSAAQLPEEAKIKIAAILAEYKGEGIS